MARTTILLLLLAYWIVSFASSTEIASLGTVINGSGSRKLKEEVVVSETRRRSEQAPPAPKANSNNAPGPLVAKNVLH